MCRTTVNLIVVDPFDHTVEMRVAGCRKFFMRSGKLIEAVHLGVVTADQYFGGKYPEIIVVGNDTTVPTVPPAFTDVAGTIFSGRFMVACRRWGKYGRWWIHDVDFTPDDVLEKISFITPRRVTAPTLYPMGAEARHLS